MSTSGYDEEFWRHLRLGRPREEAAYLADEWQRRHKKRGCKMSKNNPPIEITAVWLKHIGPDVIVDVEVNGRWVELIREHEEGSYSHICEANGIRDRLATGAE